MDGEGPFSPRGGERPSQKGNRYGENIATITCISGLKAKKDQKNMMRNDEIILKGRLDGNQRNRLVRLLDMYYSPTELAEEVGFTRRQVYRVYIPAGCPHKRDERRHIWINGKVFRGWCEETYPRVSISQDETFCLTCKKAVKITNPIRKQKGRLHYWISQCPNCGRKLARIITREKLHR